MAAKKLPAEETAGQNTGAEFDVLVVGDLNADLVLTGDVVPAFGQAEKLVDDARLTIGSSAGIFACGAARLGLRTALAGVAGADEFGAYMRRALTDRGVDTAGLIVDPALKTGLSVILSRGSDRAILTFAGSITRLKLEHLDMARLGSARHLHLAAYFLLAALRPDVPRLFAAAHAAGLSTSLDTNYDPAQRWDGGLDEVLRHTDVFLPNEVEAAAITGQADPRRALETLARRVPTVALKLGAAGALAQQGADAASAPALPGAVVDSTGAGDSFDAGFLRGWLDGWPLERCLRLACACGSLSTRAAGGTDGQPTLAEACEAAGL
jgi:sugar/nucleoside kinase (ribokinase family)